jgi:hypothetical protein
VRSSVVPSIKARLAFMLISKLYRQMYANTGIATDSARVARSTRWANLLGRACRRFFLARPMPELQMPGELTLAPAGHAGMIPMTSLRRSSGDVAPSRPQSSSTEKSAGV